MAQSIKNRVFGSDIPSQIKDKIELRQKLAKSSNFGESIDSDDKAYNFGGLVDLSSRTPFVRMWTSFDLAKDMKIGELTKAEVEAWNQPESLKHYPDHFLVEKLGGMTELHEWEKIGKYKKIYEIGNNVLNTLERGPNVSVTGDIDYKNKEGSSRTIEANTVKAILPNEQETDNNKFLKPPAGITGLTSETEGALGTIKKTTVNFIVHNFSDFENIYLRYFLRPGAQIFVDFGWDTAQLYNIENLLSVDDIEDALYGETGYVTKSNGDLETLYGHVINYDAKIREDGGFDCSVEIMSKNYSLLSNSFDSGYQENLKKGLHSESTWL